MNIRILVIALFSISLIHCGGGDNGVKARKTGGAELRGEQTATALTEAARAEREKPGESTWGRVYINDKFKMDETTVLDDQNRFQQKIELFLAPQAADPEYKFEIGQVSGAQDSQKTGIAFWGRGFKVSGQDFYVEDAAQYQNSQFDDAYAELRLNVYMDVNNEVTEVPIHFKGSDDNLGKLEKSYINGNYIQLIFSDEVGKVSLAGTINSSKYEGLVLFRNYKFDEVAQQMTNEGVNTVILGRFSVDACGFFRCNKPGGKEAAK